MPIRIRPDQLAELSTIRDLRIDVVKAITEKIITLEPSPIKPSDLLTAINSVLPSKEGELFLDQSLALCTLKRRLHFSSEDLLEELRNAISNSESPWNDDEFSKWSQVEPYLNQLLSSTKILNVVKALDLAYDHTNIFENAKILTDIRPIFNEDATTFEGAVVSYVFRIFYYDLSGNKSISLAIDDDDLERLIKICKRAQDKSKTAINFMEKNQIKTFSPGEEE